MRFKILVIGMMVIAILMQGAHATTMKIFPTDDVYTDSSNPSSNFNNINLRVGNDKNYGKHRTYLKFDLSDLEGIEVTDAKLSIEVLNPIGPTCQLYDVPSTTWHENEVTWNNAPVHGALISEKVIDTYQRFEMDATEEVQGETGKIALALISKEENIQNVYTVFFSKENNDGETYWPYLEITYEGGACNTGADSNCDGCVEMTEMLSHIDRWKADSEDVDMRELLSVISKWKSGEGC